jgi:hypothetical protein
MAENIPTQNAEEIDLGYLFEKIKSLFKSILIGIVSIIQFFWKHKFRLIGVGVLGIAIGLYLAKTAERIYVNELLIKPNYNSTQYVYDKVKAISYKITNSDSIYLQEVFGSNYKKVKNIEIEPIIDVYDLVKESEETKETFRTLFIENGDFSFFEEDINKIAYSNHKIKLIIEGKEDNEKITSQFFEFLSVNPFYENQKNLVIQQVKKELEENKFILKQIDTVITSVQSNPTPSVSSQGISFTGSQEVFELLNRKQIIFNNNILLLEKIALEDEVIKLIDYNTAMLDRSYNFSYRIVPVLFVLGYCLIFFLLYLRRKLKSVI